MILLLAQALTATAIATGGVSCALTEGGRAACWGTSSYGQLGNGMTGEAPVPGYVDGGLTFASIDVGYDTACGITAGGELWCWGRTMVGDSTSEARRTPVRIAPDLRFSSVSVGYQHACALAAGGRAWCWGRNYQGALGDSTRTTALVPRPIAGGISFSSISVSAGYTTHTCGIDTEGAAWCWGNMGRGQLGTGRNRITITPARVAGDLRFTAIAAGEEFTCGIARGGAAYCWGYNRYGSLGTGDSVNYNVPAAVAGGLGFASIDAAERSACAVTTGGEGYCWGRNQYGMLGVGDTMPRRQPAAVEGGLRFRSIELGVHWSCGLAADGIVHCWGARGRLGDQSTAARHRPGPVSTVGTAIAVAARPAPPRPAAPPPAAPPEPPTSPAVMRPTIPALAPLPGSGRIAWVRKPAEQFQADSGLGTRIWIMNGDGTRQRRLTDAGSFTGGPSFSRDGTRLAFWNEEQLSYTEINIMNAAGQGMTPVTNRGTETFGGSWSPDATRIAYSSKGDSTHDIWVTSFDGTPDVQLTSHPANDHSPAWSPDGRRIAFVSDRDAKIEIYLMNADGSNVVRLTSNDFDDSQPAWSPDGRSIAFVSTRDGNSEIYVMTAEGRDARRLTNHPAGDGNPAWSPEGTKLAFSSERDGNTEIYTINADGTALTRLTTSPHDDFSPTWGVAAATEAIAAARPRQATQPGHILIPAGQDRSQPIPVLIFFPPTFMTASQTVSEYSLPTSGFAVIAVAGAGSLENYATADSWSNTIEHYEREALADLATLASQQAIDTTRIFLAGFSMGGDLAWALTLRNPARFRGALTMGSRNSYRGRAADHRMLATRGARFYLFMGAVDEAPRVAGARSAARFLDQLGVTNRFNEFPALGHGSAPPATFHEAVAFLLGDR